MPLPSSDDPASSSSNHESLLRRLGELTWSAQDSATFLRIRSMTAEDLDQTVRWHRGALPHSYVRHLGAGFARRWQQTFLSSPHALALLAERTDVHPAKPVAFLLASWDAEAHAQHVRRHHRNALVACGVAGAVANPRLVMRFVRLRLGRLVQRLTFLPTTGGLGSAAAASAQGAAQTVRRADRPMSQAATARVVALFVDGKARHTGIGRRMLAQVGEEASRRGAGRVELQIRWGSEAEGFAERCGWRRSPARFDAEGTLVTPFYLQSATAAPLPDHRES